MSGEKNIEKGILFKMKKKLITILLTSVLMIAGTGAFLWKMNDMSNEIEEQDEAVTIEEKDLLSNQTSKAINSIDAASVIPLYLSGDNKNVVTISYASAKDIYDLEYSSKAWQTLSDVKKRAETYSPETALWAYNPYGTNNSSMYAYFNTKGRCYCRYTVSVKDKKIPDFTRTLLNQGHGTLAKEHEYQVTGLVPGKTNFIILNLYNKDDELFNTVTYKIEIPKSSTGAQTVLKSSNEYGRNKISNGLYTVFADGKKKKEKTTRIVTKKIKKNGRNVTRRIKKTVWKNVKKYAILLYDNSGVLRGEIPLDGYCGRNMEMVYDGMVYACSDDKIALVSPLGQVTNIYRLNGYKQSGEFTYDGFGNLYIVATPYRKKAVKNSCIVKLELRSNRTSNALDMNTLLAPVYQSAVKRTGKQNPDWIDINSVRVTGTNQLLVSSGTLSSIFKVNNAGSLMPKIDYIISDKSIWNNYKKLKRKVLAKTKEEGSEGAATATPEETLAIGSIFDEPRKASDVFASQAGQNAISYEKPSSLGEGQYYITMLNNNSGLKALDNDKSYYYKYLVDETTRTYMRKETQGFRKTKDEGNIVKTDDVYIYCNASQDKFREADKKGKLIKEFTFNRDIYRVYKYDWKGFWFA